MKLESTRHYQNEISKPCFINVRKKRKCMEIQCFKEFESQYESSI